MKRHVGRRVLLTMSLLAALAGACGQEPEAGFVVSGVALAGPVCPVETNPPDPACAPRPVANVLVMAVDDSGEGIDSITDADGRFSFVLVPGRYQIIAQPAGGLMGTPAPIGIEVVAGPVDVGVLAYDTGIR